MVLENQDVLEPSVLLQIKNPVAEGPKYIFDSFGRQSSKSSGVVGSFDDDLVGPNPIHAVEHALSLAAQASFNPESGKLIGDHSDRPPWRVTLGCGTAILVGAVRLNLRRSLAFIAVTEGAKATFQLNSVTGKIGGTLGAVGRNNHPPAYNWVFS